MQHELLELTQLQLILTPPTSQMLVNRADDW